MKVNIMPHLDKILQNMSWREGKYFVAQCLDVEVSSFGDTRAEAIANLQEALELYFKDADYEKDNSSNEIRT